MNSYVGNKTCQNPLSIIIGIHDQQGSYDHDCRNQGEIEEVVEVVSASEVKFSVNFEI